MELPPTLREYLLQKDKDLAAKANHLWQVSRPIHEAANRPDSNENGRPHVKTVENNIWRLLQTTTRPNRANNLDDFVPFELFLLSCAACCHDFDKAMKSKLPSGFKHGEGSGDFVVKNASALGFNRPQTRAIQNVISIHDKNTPDFQESLKSLKRRHAWAGGTCDLQRLAVLLKAADILHCDGSRIPEIRIDPENLKGTERKKYYCRHYTDGWKSDGARIIIQTDPKAEEHVKAVTEGFRIMK